MNEMENIFDEAIRKADKCNECGAITARIGGDSVAHWCCNCGAKLKGNYVYAASDIPPRVWDDEKKQYSYLKVSFKSCFDKNETTVQEEVPMPKPDRVTQIGDKPRFYSHSADQLRKYGAACRAAGEAVRKTDEYVAGVKAENARCRQILIDKMKHYDTFHDRALEAQCFDHAQILLGGWAYEAALREALKDAEVKQGEVK